MVGCLCLIGSFVSPAFVIAGFAGFRSKWNTVRRTAKGNEYAEYIWGMKNFIHDYSNLSEADKNQLVLWEDYLVYAVVLEENQQIVNDICNRRRKTR